MFLVASEFADGIVGDSKAKSCLHRICFGVAANNMTTKSVARLRLIADAH